MDILILNLLSESILDYASYDCISVKAPRLASRLEARRTKNFEKNCKEEEKQKDKHTIRHMDIATKLV